MSETKKRQRRIEVTIRIVCYELEGTKHSNQYGLTVCDKVSNMANHARGELLYSIEKNAEVDIESSEHTVHIADRPEEGGGM